MTTALKLVDVEKNYIIFSSPYERLRAIFRLGNPGFCVEALKPLSMQIEVGSTVGIIGKNGSGKSTLLKLISGDLYPTAGRIDTVGHVKLLRLGLGLDLELTGTENIDKVLLLRGVAGADKALLKREIEDFCELDKYLNYPTKTYSSGMLSRLSFAIAIFQPFELLLIDEVLAVGDAAFSSKCYKKIREICASGQTVIIVTHDSEAIKTLCNRAIWLENGEVQADGPPARVVNDYLRYHLHDGLEIDDSVAIGTDEKTEIEHTPDNPVLQETAKGFDANALKDDFVSKRSYGSGGVDLVEFSINGSNSRNHILEPFHQVQLLFHIEVKQRIERFQVGFVIYDWMGMAAAHSNNDIFGLVLENLPVGEHRCLIDFKMPGLRNGNYSLHLGCQDYYDKEILYLGIDNLCFLKVENHFGAESQGGYAIIESGNAALV